jgi:hypothetical protein
MNLSLLSGELIMPHNTANRIAHRLVATPSPRELLASFIELVDRFICAYADAVQRSLHDDEVAQIANSVGEALRHQIRELGGYMEAHVPRMSPQARSEVNLVLRMQSVQILLHGGIQAASGQLSPEKVRVINGTFEVVKKTLHRLLETICKKSPRWSEEMFGTVNDVFVLLSSFLFMNPNPQFQLTHRSDPERFGDGWKLAG